MGGVRFLLREALTMAGTKIQEVQPRSLTERSSTGSWEIRRLLSFGPLGLAAIQAVCAAAVALSGFRTPLGFSSLIAAPAAGPPPRLHPPKFPIPILPLPHIPS